MDPTAFIVGLTKQNTDALGFIPRPALVDRFIRPGHYVIQRNRFYKPLGFIVHGPVNRIHELHIHQTCIELDQRNRRYGLAAVQTVLDRAVRGGATAVVLRCAQDLEAIAFWTALGFRATHVTTGGRRRRRTIVHFRLEQPQLHT